MYLALSNSRVSYGPVGYSEMTLMRILLSFLCLLGSLGAQAPAPPVGSTILGPNTIGSGVHQLPAASLHASEFRYVTDALTAGSATGGGSAQSILWSNGTSWVATAGNGGGSPATCGTPDCTVAGNLSVGGGFYAQSTIDPLSAPTATLLAVAGNMTDGDHQYCITFTTSAGETLCGPFSAAVTVDSGHQQVQIARNNSMPAGATFWNIYRTYADCPADPTNFCYSPVQLAHVAAATSTYTDNVSDMDIPFILWPSYNNTAGLTYNGANPQAAWSPNKFVLNSSIVLVPAEWQGIRFLDPDGDGFGVPRRWLSGPNVQSNLFIGADVGHGEGPPEPTGHNNLGFGQDALFSLSNGASNIGVGSSALNDLTTGQGNVAIGNAAGRHITGDNNVIIGFSAAASPTAISNQLWIDVNNHAQPLVGGDFSARTVAIDGDTGPLAARPNHAICWQSDGRTLGYCSSVIGIDGTCTCN